VKSIKLMATIESQVQRIGEATGPDRFKLRDKVHRARKAGRQIDRVAVSFAFVRSTAAVLGILIPRKTDRMLGQQLPWTTLADAAVWPTLGRKFPGVSDAFRGLADTMEKTFNRNFDPAERNLAVYSTGRLACEDMVEIAFLVEHGYGFAATKLLRGIYERTVVGRYIASNPDEALRFFEFYVIDRVRFDNRLFKVYVPEWKRPPSQELDEFKKKFKYKNCPECGRAPQDSFTSLALPDIAKTIPVSRPTQDGTKKTTMEEFYLIGAAFPNAHIHASMWSFFQRQKSTGNDVVWNDDQWRMVEFALSAAHFNMPMIFESQNDFFKLGLEEEIEARKQDWVGLWKTGMW
jgi:hypothetical protein